MFSCCGRQLVVIVVGHSAEGKHFIGWTVAEWHAAVGLLLWLLLLA